MKKLLLTAAVFGLVPGALMAQGNSQLRPGTEQTKPATERPGAKISGSWICVMDKGTPGNSVAAQANQAASTAQGRVTHTYTGALKGFSVRVPDHAIERIRSGNPSIQYCEQDQVVKIAQHGKPNKAIGIASHGDVTPWGVALVGGGSGSGFARAWVIDSGIQPDHPDLNVDRSRSRSFVYGISSYADGNGHGTHVAGTIAAKANGAGVIGVAPGAPVVSLRVFDASGSGSNSAVLAAVDWVYRYASAGDVVNMSLGGGTSTTLDNAVLDTSNRGIYFSLAAGNESSNANFSSPGRVNGPYVWTVSAFDSSQRFASFSNYGNPPIDVSEPGVDITSTWIGSGYRSISGTSMAAPHLSGLILQRSVRNGGRVSGDPDGYPDIIGIK